MKNVLFTALTITLALGPNLSMPKAFAANNERAIEKAEDQKSELEKERRTRSAEKPALQKAASKAKVEMDQAKRALDEIDAGGSGSSRTSSWKDPDGSKPGWKDPGENAAYDKAQREYRRKESAWQEADAAYQTCISEESRLKDEIRRLEDRIERLSAKIEDCPDGNCGRVKVVAPNQGKSTLEGVADIIRAGTPLALGIGGGVLGYMGMKQSSSDYRYYAANQASLGLPVAAPNNNYGGILGAALGPSFAASLGMNGFGGGIGNLYGGGIGGIGLGGIGGIGGIGGGAFAIGQASVFSPIAAGGGFAPFSMGMGGIPYAMGVGGYAPYSMGGGIAIGGGVAGAFSPYAIGGGGFSLGMGGYAPYAMGAGGYAPYAMGGGGFAIGGGIAIGGVPYAAGIGGYAPYAMGGGGYAPIAIGIGQAMVGSFAPVGGSFAPYGVGGGSFSYAAGYAPMSVGGIPYAGGGYAPMAIGIGQALVGSFAPVGGSFSPYAAGVGIAPYGAPYAGGGFSPPIVPGYNSGIPGGYPGGGYPGGYPGGFPQTGVYPGGVGIQNPYANPMYGQNPSCMGGMCSYNPYMTTMNGQYNAGGMGNFYNYQAGQAAAQARMYQQQGIFQSDAQVASAGLQDAMGKYQSVMGQMQGSYYGGGQLSYGGAGYYSPYYGGNQIYGGTITGAPGSIGLGQPYLNQTRQ